MTTRTITLENSYANNSEEMKNRMVNTRGYIFEEGDDSSTEILPGKIKKVLPPEWDIFSELPPDIYNNEDAKSFLEELRKKLLAYNKEKLEGVYLSKLKVTEKSDIVLVIEWIFNYFRLYYSFDKEEGNYYGEVHSNIERGSFHNEYYKMNREEYSMIAEIVIDFAVVMAGGGA